MPAMGRRRTLHHDLPPGMHCKGGRYYYGRNDVALGGDLTAAMRKWAELAGERVRGGDTFADAVREYRIEELGKKAPATQKGYDRQLDVLVKVFGRVRLAALTPHHVETFLKVRGRTVSATREKALLSAVFNFARGAGLTSAANPCAGIRGTKAKRDRYVSDDELRAGVDASGPALATFLELAYRTGQRPSDVLRMTRADVQDGALLVQQAKTGAKVRIAVTGALQALLDRPQAVSSLYLVHDDRGQPLTLRAMQKRWETVRARIGATWQLRDIRAKAASDTPELRDARELLGHANETTTDTYRRHRVGTLVAPMQRDFRKK